MYINDIIRRIYRRICKKISANHVFVNFLQVGYEGKKHFREILVQNTPRNFGGNYSLKRYIFILHVFVIFYLKIREIHHKNAYFHTE